MLRSGFEPDQSPHVVSDADRSRSVRMTRHFHEKAAPCQVNVLVVRHDSFPPTSGRRTVRFLQQLPSPTRPTSIRTLLWSYCSGASWVFSIWNGRCRLGAELDIAVSSDLVPSACRSHPNSAIGSNPVRQLSSFAPAVNYDCAMARTLRRLPRAGEVRIPSFRE